MLYPLRFEPIFRRYLWGGRRLGEDLGKSIGIGSDYAESWEVCDRGADQSRVANGPLSGATLHELLERDATGLIGRGHRRSQFPLLFKFLDAHSDLSVQVHPNDAQAARLTPPDLGKTEAWIILDAAPGSRVYAGLKSGVDRAALARALNRGNCEDVLHAFEPQIWDCVFLPAGTVHAIGAGLLVAEIQQASDTTWRLFDWNRQGPDGKPRQLHIAAALDAIDFTAGPVNPQCPQPTENDAVSRLVACEKFVLDRWDFSSPQVVGGDDRFHLIAVVSGEARLEGDPSGGPLGVGGTALLPANIGECGVYPTGAVTLLDCYLP